MARSEYPARPAWQKGVGKSMGPMRGMGRLYSILRTSVSDGSRAPRTTRYARVAILLRNRGRADDPTRSHPRLSSCGEDFLLAATLPQRSALPAHPRRTGDRHRLG